MQFSVSPAFQTTDVMVENNLGKQLTRRHLKCVHTHPCVCTGVVGEALSPLFKELEV